MDDMDVDDRAKTPLPPHVPADRLYEIDMYKPAGIETEGYLKAWKRLQDEKVPDLVWSPFNGGHWIATSGALIREIYTDPERFSSQVLFIPKAAGEKYAMVPSKMDPPEHRPYRAVVDKGLNLRAIREREPQVRALAISLIEKFADRGACDFVEEFSAEFPIQVFMTMADLPMEDSPKLRALASGMTRPGGNSPEEMAANLDQANKGFFDYVGPIIDERRGKPGTDIISICVNTDINGAMIERQKLLGMISLLLLAGLDSVTNFMNMMMDHLGRHPETVAILRDNPDELRRAVEEMFRRFPLVAAARMIARDIELDGVELKAGEMVLLPTALAGLDERQNPDPWALDFHRSRISHSTFGEGPHRCAGLHLARLESTILLEEWLKRIPFFHVAKGSEPRFESGVVASVDNVHLEWEAA
ncbi:MAG: cytochrome P450 [Novosphingobium sp.]